MSPLTYARGKRYWRQRHSYPYEFNDQFGVPHAAVFPSPQIAVPGPGSWLVSDADSRMSIPAGGGLLYTGIGAQQWDRCILTSTVPFIRHSGRYCEFELTPTMAAAYLRGGWNFNLGTSAGTGSSGQILANEATIYVGGGGFINVTDGLDVASPLYPYTLGVSYTFRVYDTGTGWLYYARLTSVPDSWALLWERVTSFPVVPHFNVNLNNHSVQGTCSHFFVRQGLAKPPVAGESQPGVNVWFSGAADGLIDAEVLAPTNDVRSLVFRASDANNYWYAQLNTTNQTFQLHKVVGGVDNTISLTSTLWVPGAVYRLRIVMFANHIRTFYATNSGPSTDDSFNETSLLFGTQPAGNFNDGDIVNLRCQTGGKLLLN